MSEKTKTGMNWKFLTQAEQLSLFIAFAIMCIALALLTPTFLSSTNLSNLLKQTSIVGIAALGACLIILIGEIDLTVGNFQAAAGCFMVFILNYVVKSFILALILTLLLGVLVGFVNAIVVTKGKINSFIATLGTMAIIKGATFVLTKAASIQNTYPGFDFWGTGNIIGIPIPVIFFIVLCAIVHYVLNYTVLGRNIYAVGGNASAARLSGLNVVKIKIIVFMIGSIFAALTAVITASRLNSGQPTAGTGFELLVISAVILGGVSMTGGRGNILGVVMGVLILSVLSNGLVLLNVSSFYQEIARGLVIIIAVFLDENRKRNLSRKLLQVNC